MKALIKVSSVLLDGYFYDGCVWLVGVYVKTPSTQQLDCQIEEDINKHNKLQTSRLGIYKLVENLSPDNIKTYADGYSPRGYMSYRLIDCKILG